jgi:hypothetical protein
MSLSNTEKHVKDIRRKTRRKFSSEEKIRIVLDGLRGEYSIAELYLRNDWLKKSLTGQDVMLDMNTKLQLDMGLFLSCFCSVNKIKSLSTGPMEDLCPWQSPWRERTMKL